MKIKPKTVIISKNNNKDFLRYINVIAQAVLYS